ncbi:MAG: sporulation integral membrane protein YlbJ [Clostridia bacterium]|nr:sporulation integral membrane protein YlbJ [Clostridia bacterium]
MLYILISVIAIYLLIPSKKVKFSFIKLKNYIIPLTVIAILVLLVIFSNDAFNSAHTGLMLWANNVVPSLFPFLICIEILKKTNIIQVIGKLFEPIIRPIFNIPGSGAFAVVMGMCSGYPVGAKFAASLREANQCSKIEGERILSFTNTSGPLFILGAVGIGMFRDNKIGFILLTTHFIATLLVGFLFRFYKYNKRQTKSVNICDLDKNKIESNIKKDKIDTQNAAKNNCSNHIKLSKFGSIMGEAIKNSISTLLLICGFITFFSVLGSILDSSGITSNISNIVSNIFVLLGFSKELATDLAIGCFKGILEITNGIKVISNISCDTYLLLPIVATILGFGGISVHMQVASIISNTDLSITPYLVGKTLHGVIAGIITYILINYTNIINMEAVETFSSITTNNIISHDTISLINGGNILLLSFSFIVIISLIILMFKKNIYNS